MDPDQAKVTIVLENRVRNIELRCFDNSASRDVATGIIKGETYPPIPFLADVRTIIDIGANIGAAAVYFGLLYPEATVFALEPGHDAFELLVRNARQVSNIRPFNLGLFSDDRSAQLFSGAVDSVTASVGDSALNTAKSETVVLRHAGAWLQEQGIESVDMLKVDTEGCEVPILRFLVDRLPRIKAIYVEYHIEDDRRAIDDLLRPTHVLYRGRAPTVHRGEFTYVGKSAFPSPEARDRDRIDLPPT